jgi:hypothetical protein
MGVNLQNCKGCRIKFLNLPRFYGKTKHKSALSGTHLKSVNILVFLAGEGVLADISN